MKNNQRKTKIAVFAFFAVASFLIAGSKISFAQEESPKKLISSVVVANVDIRDAKIEKQENNVLTISFNISNGFDQVQPGVLLRASLAKNENNLLSVVDEKIIGSEFTLGSKENSHREITYSAPNFLQGKYEIWLNAQTAGGLPLSTKRVGEITFSGTNDYVEIVNSSCFLKVKGESEDKKYVPTQGVDIEKNENLQAVCDLMNHSDQQRKFSAQFEMFQHNTFGALLETSEKTDASFTLQSKQKKQFIFDLPKAKDPQVYDIKLMLQENKKTISNSSVFRYVLRGASATIQSLQMDKDSYQKGEKARVSVMVTGPADNFSGSRHGAGTDLKGAVLLAKIQSGKTLCSQIKITPSLIGMPNDIGIAIAENCPDPAVLVLIKDSAGNVLAQRNFFVGKNSQAEMEKTVQPQANGKNGKSFATILTILITLLIILIIIFIIIWKFKKRSSIIVPLLFFGLGLAISLHVAHPARAGYIQFLYPPCTVCETQWECPDPYDSSSCYILPCDDILPNCDRGTITYGAYIGLDKSVYFPGESLTAYAYDNGANGGVYRPGEVSVTFNGQNYVVVYSDGTSGSATGTAESTPGWYSATFSLWGYGQYGEHADAEEWYQVVQPPQNGVCGWVNGTAGCGPPPGWSLCSVGPPSGVSDYGYWSWSCGGAGGGANASCWAGKTVINASCGWALGDITNPFQPTDGFCDQGQIAGGVSDNGTNWSWTCGSNCNGASALCTKAKPPIDGKCRSGQTFCSGTSLSDAELCEKGTASTHTTPNTFSSSFSWSCSGYNGGSTDSTCSASTYSNVGTRTISNVCQGSSITTDAASLCYEGKPGYTAIVKDLNDYYWTCKDSCGNSKTSPTYTKKAPIDGQCGTADGESLCNGLGSLTLCKKGTASPNPPTLDGYDASWQCKDSNNCGGQTASCSARGKKSCGWIESVP